MAWRADAGGAAGGGVGVEPVVFVVVGVGRGVARAVPPGALEILEPAVEVDEWFAADVVDADAAVVLVWLGFDEAGFAEVSEVFADDRLGLMDPACEFGDGARRVGEFPDDLSPDRVGEKVEGRERPGWAGVIGAVLHVVFGMHRLRSLYRDFPRSQGLMR